MDAVLEAKLTELKKYYDVYGNPLANIQDALTLADSNHAIYAFAQNGANYGIRWTQDHGVVNIHESEICIRIVDRMLDLGRNRQLTASTVTETKSVQRRKATQAKTQPK